MILFTDETADSLYATVLAHPDLDPPRLVLADRLEENGQADWAEFIRVTCEVPREWGRRTLDLFSARKWDWFPGLEGCDVVPPWTDGAVPAITVRRGFPAEVRAPLDWLRGGECECVQRWDRTITVNPSVLWEYPNGCYTCQGTGRTPGHLAELVRRWPIQRVVVVDREPHQRPNGFWLWFDANVPRQTAELPRELFRFLRLTDVFPTREAAVTALSDALLQEAREGSATP